MSGNEKPSHENRNSEYDDPPLLPPEIREWLRHYWDLPRTKSKWTDISTVILTAALAGFALWSVFVFDGQLQEMHRATEVANTNFRIDERAWLSLGFAGQTYDFKINEPFSVPIEIANTGKTPAKEVKGYIAVHTMMKGDPVDFDYSPGHAVYKVDAGTVFPNQHLPNSYKGVRHGAEHAEDIIVTIALRKQISSGDVIIVALGRITYRDVMGVEHWTTFCHNAWNATPVSDECTRYNDTDDNQ